VIDPESSALGGNVHITVSAVDNNVLRFTIGVTNIVDTVGWLGFGFPTTPKTMLGSDVVIGRKSNDVYIVDDYMIGTKKQLGCPAGVCPDVQNGGKNDLQNVAFSSDSNSITLVFERLRNTGDAQDVVIGAPGTTQNFVIARGSSNDLAYHQTRSTGTFVVPSPSAVAVDCVVSGWGDWGPCSAACGAGTQVHSRSIVTSPQGAGAACPVLQESKDCNNGACTVNVCAHTQAGLQSWKSWSGKPTTAGQDVTIPAGTLILFDESPGFVLGTVLIQGQLVFSNVGSLKLEARYVLVKDGGHLYVGSEACPLSNPIEIVLWATKVPSDHSLELANKVLGVFDGGQLDLHGVPRLPTWTVLDQTAYIGDTSVTLATSVQWAVGDVIVIATTDYSRRSDQAPMDMTNQDNDVQDELRTVTGVSVVNGKSIVKFAQPLRYTHYGKIWTTPDNLNTIDMRGEVGSLTRNIIVRGDLTEGTTLSDKWGGHIMVTGSRSSARIQGVELYNVGQSMNKARYPIHFHECGEQPTSYVKQNSIHDSFQRACTIHLTNSVTVQDNVVYNITGHAFFVEDGTEENNRFVHNLAIRSNPHKLLVADAQPAMFWTTNPANIWIDNVAVGGYFGFWFAMPYYPLGLAVEQLGGATAPLRLATLPRFKQVTTFRNNKAHSNVRNGLHIDDGQKDDDGNTEMSDYNPFPWEEYIPHDSALSLVTQPHGWRKNKLDAAIWNTPLGQGLFDGFTAYKNVEFGIWGRGRGIVINNAKLADNQVGCQFPGTLNIVQNSIIVGETDNYGNSVGYWIDTDQGRTRVYRWNPSQRILGYRHYDNGGPDLVRDTTFYNFQDSKFLFNNKTRKAGGIGVMGGQTVLPSEHRYLNLKFVNTPNHVYLEPSGYWYEPALTGAAIRDVDGSLTGKCGSEITSSPPILATSQCTYYPLWNATVCPPGTNPHRYFRVEDNTGVVFSGADSISRAYTYVYRLPDLVTHRLAAYNLYGSSLQRRYGTANLMVNNAYLLKWGDLSETPSKFRVGFEDGINDEWIRIATPYPAGTTFTFDPVRTATTSLSTLTAYNYFYDASTGLLWFEMRTENVEYYRAYDHFFSSGSEYNTVTAVCPGGVCTSAYTPNAASFTSLYLPASVPAAVCESTGNLLGGEVVFTQVPNSPEYYFFQDALASNRWTLNTDDGILIDAAVASPSSPLASVRYPVTPARRALVISRQWQDRDNVFDVSPYTHLAFKVRKEQSSLGGAIPSMRLEVSARNKDWGDLPGGQSVGSQTPFVNPTFPIDDRDQWHQVYVPLKKLGVTDYKNLHVLVISNTDWDWQFGFNFWLDDIKLASYTSQIVADPSEALITTNVNFAYDYNTSPVPSPIPTSCPKICPVAGAPQYAYSGSSVDLNGSPAPALPSWVVPVVVFLGLCVFALLVVVIVLKASQVKMRSLMSEYA